MIWMITNTEYRTNVVSPIGSERIDEVFDPEIAISRAILYYKNKGYDDNWIKMRLTGIVDRFKLTDAWKASGINKPFEYGILTNEIYVSKDLKVLMNNQYKKIFYIPKIVAY